MLTIDKSNNITLTRGDTLTLTVSLLKDNELSRNTTLGFDTASA